MDLEKIKGQYSSYQKKYALPSFKELNENFEIEKIESESETFLRAIRKICIEKILNSLSFLELLMNPVNAPRFYHQYLRAINEEIRKEMEELYNTLGELSIHSLSLEIEYSEKAEAELIKNINKTWNSKKDGFKKVLSALKKTSLNNKKEKSYYG